MTATDARRTEAAEDDRRRHSRASLALWVLLGGYCVAFAATFVEVETVLASAPILLGLSAWTITSGRRARVAATLAAPVLVIVTCLALFLAVNIYNWGPRAAEEPFAIIGAVVLLLLLFFVGMAQRRLRHASAPPVVSTAALLPVPVASSSPPRR